MLRRSLVEIKGGADVELPAQFALQDVCSWHCRQMVGTRRLELLAIAAPVDQKSPGMMAYTLHYTEELRDPADYSRDVKQSQVREDELSMALELIKRKSAKFEPDKFTDEYEAALKEFVRAKLHKRPLPEEEPEAKPGKVIDLMDGLRKSVHAGPHGS
jgi:DNA end-binding protein Ku